MYVNGTIVVSDENGMKAAIPYVDNVEDMLILENEILFLEESLKKDEKSLKEKSEERVYRNKVSKHISIIGSLIAVGATFGVAQLAGFSHEEITNTVMGPMSEYLAFSIPMSVGCVGAAQMFSLLSLSYRPSKKDIKGIEEKIKYEKEMIRIFKDELEYLGENPTYNRQLQVVETVSYDVHYKSSLMYLNEALKLRYAYGYNPNSFIKLFNDGQLPYSLSEQGFSDDVIMDFLSFMEEKIKDNIKDSKLSKK